MVNSSANITFSKSLNEVKLYPEHSIYWYGNEFSDVTGGWTQTKFYDGSSYVSATKNSTNLSLENVSTRASSFHKLGFATNSMNITSYNSIHFNLAETLVMPDDNLLFFLCTASSLSDSKSSSLLSGMKSSKQIVNGTFSAGTDYSLDISSDTGNYYIVVYVAVGYASVLKTIKFSALWLE